MPPDDIRHPYFQISARARRERSLRRALMLSAAFNAVLFGALLWRSLL